MSGKFKAALVVLAFTALVSVFSLLSSIQPSRAPLDAAIGSEFPETFSMMDDEDGDGLSNRDENLWRTDWQTADTDGDGYKDGEEVLSGHDPAKRGPDDALDRNVNLSERMSSLLLGGIIVGDLKPDSPQYETALATVVDEIFNQHERQSTVTVEPLNLVETSTESMVAYAQSTAESTEADFFKPGIVVYELIKKNGQAPLPREQVLMAAEFVGERAAHYAGIAVPKAAAEHHRRGLTLLRMVQQELQTWADSGADDPLTATLSATRLSLLVTDGLDLFLKSYEKAMGDFFLNDSAL